MNLTCFFFKNYINIANPNNITERPVRLGASIRCSRPCDGIPSLGPLPNEEENITAVISSSCVYVHSYKLKSSVRPLSFLLVVSIITPSQLVISSEQYYRYYSSLSGHRAASYSPGHPAVSISRSRSNHWRRCRISFSYSRSRPFALFKSFKRSHSGRSLACGLDI